MLSDAQWTELEPLVEACRPKGKTPPEDLRRTLSATLWRHHNGEQGGERSRRSVVPGGEPRNSSSAGCTQACGSAC